MRAPGLVLLLAALLAGCQTPPPVYQVERARSYAQPEPAVRAEILAFLASRQITLTGTDPGDGSLLAERHAFQDLGWAECEHAWVIDHSSNSARPTRARPVARDLALRIGLEQVGGTTEVTALARFTEQQIDPYRNLPFTQPCRSKGVLERALFDAL